MLVQGQFQHLKDDRDALFHENTELGDSLERAKRAQRLAETRLRDDGESYLLDVEQATGEVEALRNELNVAEEAIEQKESELQQMASRNESLHSKCKRLRDYVRKMATKCDQWEEFHYKQADVLEKLKRANERTRQKASKLARRDKVRAY